MITFLTLKKALKKAWVWIRHNWYVPAVLIYTLVLWLFFRRKGSALLVLEERNESYKKQIKAPLSKYLNTVPVLYREMAPEKAAFQISKYQCPEKCCNNS